MHELRHNISMFFVKVIFYIQVWIRQLWWTVIMKYLTMFAFYIIKASRTSNQDYYDRNIAYLYQKARVRRAFSYKVSIVNLGKQYRNVRVLMLETEDGTQEVKLSAKKNPELFVKSNS